MDSFLRIYLPLFLTGFIFLVFVVPSMRVYRQTGINPFRFTTSHNKAHDYIGASMKLFIGLLLLTVLVYSLSPNIYAYLSPFTYLQVKGLKIIGLAIGHICTIGIIIAQLQMKQSWRIGIDYQNKTDLVTKGLFSFSRNPIFLFLIFALLGLFLVIPNAMTFAVLFAAYLVLHITMRLEEDFLLKQHGTAYYIYQQKVRRLI